MAVVCGLFLACGDGFAQPLVTGIVVDEAGKPLEGVRYAVAGTPSIKPGNRVHYSGEEVERKFTDKEGKFAVSVPWPGELADLQFDGGEHAPVFVYRVSPTNSPLRVVMTKGKVLRGRIVDEQHAPIASAEIELQMAQEDRWYQRRGITDTNGEFQFRISEPPQRFPWTLCYAGKRFKVEYNEVTPKTVITLTAEVRMILEPEGGKGR